MLRRKNAAPANGNLLQKSNPNGAELYEYNGFNQLVIIKQGEGGAAYGYNASGIRVSKQVGDTYTYYLLDGGDVVAECTDDALSAIYLRGFNLIYRTTADGTDYYLHDAHGDVVALTDDFGAVTKRYAYDAFGNEENPDDSDTNPFRYCGEYFDKETRTYYLRARYYDPAIGRFTQQDPIKYGLNWYVYCSSNPVLYTDPSGLFDYNTRLTCSSTYNEDVEALQNALVNLGYLDAANSRWGYFDSQTLAAVNAYKNAVGLWNFGEYEGVVGITTWESLGLVYRTQADIDIGVSIVIDGQHVQYKDFTVPIQNALNKVVVIAQSRGRFDYRWFISQVNHEAAWDIKVRDSWNKTIGDNTYPGFGVQVLFKGTLMTPEKLGNYTYGYIGKAMGLTYLELVGGSWYAADFPTGHSFWTNEYLDWFSISAGMWDYVLRR